MNKLLSVILTMFTAISFSHLRSSKTPALFITMSMFPSNDDASSKASINWYRQNKIEVFSERSSAIIVLGQTSLLDLRNSCFIFTSHLLVIRYVSVYEVHLLLAERFFDAECDPFASFGVDVQYNYFL